MSELKDVRVDVVGSLLRPPALKEAQGRFEAGELDVGELRRVVEVARQVWG